MRENRLSGSEGGEAGYPTGLPYPYRPISRLEERHATIPFANPVAHRLQHRTDVA